MSLNISYYYEIPNKPLVFPLFLEYERFYTEPFLLVLSRLSNIIYWILKVLTLILSRKYSKRLSALFSKKTDKSPSKYQPVKYKGLNQNW